MDKQLERILPHVLKPARYTNNELNAIHKDWDHTLVKMALAFPDVYEVGMGNLGFKILYHIINQRQDALAERSFAPWVDMEEKMREENIPLWALESRRPLRDFDIVGFTLQYEMSYTNIVNMLDLAGIPRFSKARTADDPLVIAGGPCAFNVEPMADFFDFVLLGEGEEAIHEIIDLISQAKTNQWSKQEQLSQASRIPGVYVPSLYQPRYDREDNFAGIEPIDSHLPKKVSKRLVKDLNGAEYPDKFVVPFIEVVHDRAMVEVFRGCTRGCRFCQAGMIYRPVRERDPAVLQQQIKRLVENTGYDEISLTSLSSGDYSCIADLITDLVPRYQAEGVALSLPSLRVDSFSVSLANEIQKVRKTGLTFAPEAGTQRLRDVINKNVCEEDLLAAVQGAFSSGWHAVKLYFMIGLPSETYQDLDGIADLAHRVLAVGKRYQQKGKKRPSVTVSVSSFVPKSHTPFQWDAQDDEQTLYAKQDYLKGKLRRSGINFQYHDVRTSFLEGIFARGDRRLAAVVAKAVDLGCHFDGWDEHFNYPSWLEAFNQVGTDPVEYNKRELAESAPLPWDHLDSGVSKRYFLKERQSAYREAVTDDCRHQNCTGCALCPDYQVANLLHKGDENE